MKKKMKNICYNTCLHPQKQKEQSKVGQKALKFKPTHLEAHPPSFSGPTAKLFLWLPSQIFVIQSHSNLCTEQQMYIPEPSKLRESADISAVRYKNLNGMLFDHL